MNPYRISTNEFDPSLTPTEAVRDAVSHMVQQFADPFAFYRELIQNSIDAGSNTIDVRLTWEPTTEELGTLRIVVSDDGCGMTRNTIEQCLLVLFRSSKDGDPTKIGKFGVGFFSVFAVAPQEVRVDTGTDNDGWRLELRPDYTYTLKTAPARRGTTVTLKIPKSLPDAARFAHDSLRAILHWCPHVHVPLRFASAVPGVEIDTRIDRPFGIDAPVTVIDRPDDDTAIAVALSETPRSQFYNRGILLHESSTELIDGVSCKIDSAALSHTISRDNIRRDATYHRLVDRARKLAHTALRSRWLASLNEALLACAHARHHGHIDEQAARRFEQLSRLLAFSPFTLLPSEIRWPLVHPVQCEPGTVPRLHADEPNALTALLQAHNIPIMDLGAAGADSPGEALRKLYFTLVGTSSPVSQRYCAPCIVPNEALSNTERTLLSLLQPLLASVGIEHVALAEPVGAGSDLLFLALDPAQFERPQPSLVIDAADASTKLFSLFGSRGVALARHHPRVRAALQAASIDPLLAAVILARLVLLAAGKLDAKRDRTLLERALHPSRSS